jgi:hypothetical protein
MAKAGRKPYVKSILKGKTTEKLMDDPIFNEFLYTILYEATYEEKRGLQGKYLDAAMKPGAAKRFIDNATIDEKDYILSHFGIRWFRVFVKDDTVNREKLTEILKKFAGKQRIESFKDIADAKIFVSSDKTFNRLMAIMAQSMHSPAYYLNLEYVRAGYHIHDWPKINISQKNMEMREVLEASSNIARLMLCTMLRMKVAPGLTGLNEVEMSLLLYFYYNWTIHIPNDDILNFFKGYIALRQHKSAIKGLMDLKYIEDTAYREENYTITGAGIKIIDNFMKDVMAAYKL